MAQLSILDYGAIADGRTVCTASIQRAIDECKKGDTVFIPKGKFVSGALFLKGDMTLYLDEGAYLIGSTDISDYPILSYSFEGRMEACYASLLNTDREKKRRITIEGKGTIDGQGSTLYRDELAEAKGKRGRVICIQSTEELIIRGVTVRHSPAWCLHLLYCHQVLIQNVSVFTKYAENGDRYHLHNGDGIDVDSCEDVLIKDCLIASQDDCIAIKSGRDEEGRALRMPSRNILIEGCCFESGFGVAIGSEMSGGVEGVTVKDCVFRNTFSLASIKPPRPRGGFVRNILFEGCTHENQSTEFGMTQWFRGAIYMDAFYGCVSFDADTPMPLSEGTATVENITFRDISVNTVAGYAVYICGLPEMPFKGITLQGVRAHGEFGMTVKNAVDITTEDIHISSDKS